MIDITFKINGKKVNPNNVTNALEAALLQSYSESIKKSIGSLRCHEHNQAPKITVKGKTLDNLSLDISGCCDDIIQKATNKLK